MTDLSTSEAAHLLQISIKVCTKCSIVLPSVTSQTFHLLSAFCLQKARVPHNVTLRSSSPISISASSVERVKRATILFSFFSLSIRPNLFQSRHPCFFYHGLHKHSSEVH